MAKSSKTTIEVKGSSITVLSRKDDDYISLTDIARVKSIEHTDDLIRNWLRNRNTVEFLGVWERPNNPGFNPVEFDGIRMKAGLNSFTLTPKQWIEKTGATGIISKAGADAGPNRGPCRQTGQTVADAGGFRGRDRRLLTRLSRWLAAYGRQLTAMRDGAKLLASEAPVEQRGAGSCEP